MRLSKYSVIIIALALGCDGPPPFVTIDFPVEPHIQYQNQKTYSAPDFPNKPDSLNVEFYVSDGDFDLGLDFGETSPPFNQKFYFIKSSGQKIADSDPSLDLTKVITLKDRKLAGGDTLPKFIHPYNCTRWEIRTINANQDTVLMLLNPNYNNIFIDFYTQVNSIWTKYDWINTSVYPVCHAPYYLRFGSSANTIPVGMKQISDQEAIMSLKLPNFFRTSFTGTKVKLKIRIQDRALHKSNEIETTEIQY